MNSCFLILLLLLCGGNSGLGCGCKDECSNNDGCCMNNSCGCKDECVKNTDCSCESVISVPPICPVPVCGNNIGSTNNSCNPCQQAKENECGCENNNGWNLGIPQPWAR